MDLLCLGTNAASWARVEKLGLRLDVGQSSDQGHNEGQSILSQNLILQPSLASQEAEIKWARWLRGLKRG